MALPKCSLLLLLIAACAAAPEEPSGIYETKVQAMADLEQEQQRFNNAIVLPKKFEFPGHGEVTVLDAGLDGHPDNTYVRARWSYQNTTGRPVLQAFVSLDVLDAEGKVVASKVSVCIFPTPRLLHDGTYFMDELRTKTLDAHKQPGWSWRITCRSQYLDEEDLYQPQAESIPVNR